MNSDARPRLVVVGCGFGGFSLLRTLRRRRWHATLVSPRNYFLFTPLLPSAAAGSVELRSIVEPARRRLRDVRVVEGSATGVDWERKVLRGRAAIGGEGFELPFDHLVVAVGSEVATFGVEGVSEHAVSFASIDDARAVRRRARIEDALRFVVCGGGPPGVEVAAEIHDLLAEELAEAYPDLAPRARVVLLEAAPRLLLAFDEALADYTARHFRREGGELRTGASVRRLVSGAVELEDGETIRSDLVIWAAGSRPAGFVSELGVELDERGRVRVGPDFRIPGRSGAWALGDCAAIGDPPLPATAQVAQQAGAHLARNLDRLLRGLPARPFRFRSFGMLAYIGGRQALADLPGVKWSGRGAWLFWRSVYLTKLVSLSNKAKVLFDWIKARLFGRDLSRF